MIPKGKMMANMLKRQDAGTFQLVKFQSSQKESPEENKVLEEEFLSFMEAGITNIRKEGKRQQHNMYIYRVSQKKGGFVFRAPFRPLNGQK